MRSEKIIKQDTARRFDILVIGEEPHVAYNRVGLSSYFEHRKIEDLYLEPKEWVSEERIQQCLRSNL
jgi:nitrite reductase (NAD(P)H)